EPDLVAAVAADRPQTRLEGSALERALAEAAGAPAVNLLQGAFDPKRQAELGWRDFRRVAALAAAVLLSPLVIWGAQAAAFHIRAERAEARAEAKLAALLPEGAEVTDVAVQAEALLAQAMVGQGGGASGLAAILLGALEPLDQAQLESLIVMPDGTARAAVSLAAYSDTEALAQALQAEGLSMREEGSREEGDRVVADIILGAR
ncbi:MAG: type II secretion system protein GspL, partial [Pseudomonadota bacterium]